MYLLKLHAKLNDYLTVSKRTFKLSFLALQTYICLAVPVLVAVMSTSSQPGALDDDPGNSVKAHRDGGFSSSSDSDGPRWSLAIGVLTPVAEPADFIEQLSIQVGLFAVGETHARTHIQTQLNSNPRMLTLL